MKIENFNIPITHNIGTCCPAPFFLLSGHIKYPYCRGYLLLAPLNPFGNSSNFIRNFCFPLKSTGRGLSYILAGEWATPESLSAFAYRRENKLHRLSPYGNLPRISLSIVIFLLFFLICIKKILSPNSKYIASPRYREICGKMRNMGNNYLDLNVSKKIEIGGHKKFID